MSKIDLAVQIQGALSSGRVTNMFKRVEVGSSTSTTFTINPITAHKIHQIKVWWTTASGIADVNINFGNPVDTADHYRSVETSAFNRAGDAGKFSDTGGPLGSAIFAHANEEVFGGPYGFGVTQMTIDLFQIPNNAVAQNQRTMIQWRASFEPELGLETVDVNGMSHGSGYWDGTIAPASGSSTAILRLDFNGISPTTTVFKLEQE